MGENQSSRYVHEKVLTSRQKHESNIHYDEDLKNKKLFVTTLVKLKENDHQKTLNSAEEIGVVKILAEDKRGKRMLGKAIIYKFGLKKNLNDVLATLRRIFDTPMIANAKGYRMFYP